MPLDMAHYGSHDSARERSYFSFHVLFVKARFSAFHLLHFVFYFTAYFSSAAQTDEDVSGATSCKCARLRRNETLRFYTVFCLRRHAPIRRR